MFQGKKTYWLADLLRILFIPKLSDSSGDTHAMPSREVHGTLHTATSDRRSLISFRVLFQAVMKLFWKNLTGP